MSEGSKLEEARTRYYDAVRNLSVTDIEAIESHPKDEPGDTDKIRACKSLYRDMQSHGHGAIDLRQPERVARA